MASLVEEIILLDERHPHDEDTEDRSGWKEKEKWVTEHIKMRKCSYYIASTERESEGMCQCGYRKEDHDDYVIGRPKQEQSQQDLKWNFEQHSVSVPTNAFGEIEFVGFIGNNAKFVRVDSKTNIDMLLMLMKDVWGIKKPKFIISVIGGEENFNMKPHLRNMFQSFLVKFLRNRDVWIITGGTNIGVAKHVGEAVKYSRLNSGNENNIVAIGIAPWGVIHNKQLLVDKKFEPIQYAVEDKPIEHERILNPNHSHYILVDNGTQHQFETETALRAALELRCNTQTDIGLFSSFDDSIPVTLLVIDGGPHILKTVINALSNFIPVVIIKGSGGVADLLAYAVTDAEVSESSDKDDKGKAIRKTTKRLTNSQRRCIYNKMRSTKVCETNDIDHTINEIEACLDKFDLIRIFELGSGDQDLTKTILPAIIKTKENGFVKQLLLALHWNLIDFARSVIVTAEKGCKDRSLNSPFTYLLRNMRKKNKKTSPKKFSMEQVGQVITHLLDEYYLQQYGSNPGTDLPDDAPFENPCLHLLIWAVLNNLQDMAKLFWRKGFDSIAAALLAHALFSAMPSRLKNESPILYEGIEANSREFMDLATGVLDRSYRTCEDYTVLLLVQHLVQWEALNCISIAIKTNNKTFITATACQEVFNTMWMGDLTQENGLLKLLICTFIPPLIPLCVEFRTSGVFYEPDASIPMNPQEEVGESSHLQARKLHKTKHGDGSMKYFRRAKEKITLFYRAPVVQFLSHVISYMAFLCLYSYVLISKFDQNFSVEDVILIVCVFNIFTDEICQVIATRYTYTEIKLKAYLADIWNIADILMILLFVVGMILKHLSYQETLEAARDVHGVNLIICFLRLLQMFSLNKELGPKLVMIIRMVRNLTSFFVILLIFIVAYAIASHAILYPNTEITFNVWRIFRRPYWNIYGELMLDEIEGTNNCTNIVELYRNGTQPRCPTESGKYVVPVLLGVYMLMFNILLLNLLISIFSNTYDKVQGNADKHWRFQRYRQIHNYINRPMHIPFISCIGDIFQIIVFLKEYLRRCKPGNRTSGTNVFLERSSYEEFRRDIIRKWEVTIYHGFFYKRNADLKDLPQVVQNNVREWERRNAQDFINSKQANLESIDNIVTKITQRLDQLVSKIDALEEQPHVLAATMENPRLHPSQIDCVAKSEFSTVDEPGSVNLEKRMDNIEQKLQWLIDKLEEHKPGAEQASPEKSDERVEG